MSTSVGALKVLFVAPVAPWARENGSSLIIADQLEALARRSDVELFTLFLRRQEVSAGFAGPDALRVAQLDHVGRPRWSSLLQALLRRTSPVLVRFNNSRVSASVTRFVRTSGFRPDLVHVEHLPLLEIALELGESYGCPVVYRSHNIEAILLERRAGLPRPLALPFARVVERAECNAMERADLTLCISEADACWVMREAPRARVGVLPCAIDVARYPIADESPRVPAHIGFVGGLDWEPNERALRWFVEQVLPRVTREVPHARLRVLARGASSREWLTCHAAVDVLPRDTTPLEVFSRVGFSLAPLLEGGGVRIKIPESLCLGCPVVATTVGAEGHDLPGIIRADGPADFARACIDALTGPSIDRIALRQAVEHRHGSDRVVAQLVASWHGLRG